MVGIRSQLTPGAPAMAGVACRNIALDGRSDGKRWSICLSSRFRTGRLDPRARGAYGGVVVQRPGSDRIVRCADRRLAVTRPITPAYEPTTAVLAFAVAEMRLRVDTAPVQTGR